MAKKKVKGLPSGWHKSETGNPFHALASSEAGMSEDTIKALGGLADAVHRALEKSCPQCGGGWDDPLHWNKEQGWFCDCGWREEQGESLDDPRS